MVCPITYGDHKQDKNIMSASVTEGGHNKRTESKPKPTPIFKNRCVHYCAQLSYTTQHRTVLIIFPPRHPDNHHSSDNVYWWGEG